VQVTKWHNRIVRVLVGFADPVRKVISRFDVLEEKKTVALTGCGVDVSPLEL